MSWFIIKLNYDCPWVKTINLLTYFKSEKLMKVYDFINICNWLMFDTLTFINGREISLALPYSNPNMVLNNSLLLIYIALLNILLTQ